MKKYFSILMALAVFAFTACVDVPEPYGINAGNIADEEEVIILPAGSGTVADPYNVAGLIQAVANLPAGQNWPTEVVVKGIVSQLKNDLNPDYGNLSYYISDNGKITEQFYVYRSLGLNKEKFTADEQVQLGDVVVVQGTVTNYNGTLEFVQNQSWLLSTTNNYSGGGETVEILGDVIFYENAFDGALGDFTTNNVKLPGTSSYVWTGDKTYHCAKASGYVGGSTQESEGWLISPSINLKKATEAYLTFDHDCSKFNVDASQQVFVKAKSENDREWTVLPVEEYPSGKFVTIANINLSDFVGTKVQIAFQYTSSTASAGTWEVKNFKVTGYGEKGINGLTWEDFSNGQFDYWEADDATPTGWQEDTSKGNAKLSKSEDCYSRSYSVCIEGVALGERRLAYKELYFEPGTYTCSFYAKAALYEGRVQAGYWPQGAAAAIYDKDATGANIRTDVTGRDWTKITYSFTIEETVPVALIVAVPTGSKDKNVLVDDFTITKNQ
ncbi:MAG: choice-of-anchor J domain-containing protein [Bacteroidaceae bacterium]|nr:choice-of-anchor J domain-containing protein [Bacteroidaceae bacterium]